MSGYLALKNSNCRSCYKCIRHCPVKAIGFSEDQAHIIPHKCILCGHCFVICPQNAKDIKSDASKVKKLLADGEYVVASLDPSFIANYEGSGIVTMREALMKIGFSAVEETALGAALVRREYERILREEERDILISSSCSSVNLLIQKYFPNELQYLADVMSPMQAHCKDIKCRIPNAKTVFIGPCAAKKDEADRSSGYVDAVLTFEELSNMLSEQGVLPEMGTDYLKQSAERKFPMAGGIVASFTERVPGYTYITVDGVDNCVEAIGEIESGRIHKCFIEMSACSGSCLGGSEIEKYSRSPINDLIALTKYAGDEPFDTSGCKAGDISRVFRPIGLPEDMPTEHQLTSLLRQMGKYCPADELNCGICGYDTCREMAIAVYQRKAEVTMCLPFLKDKAESFSDTVVKNSPSGFIVLNDVLEIQQINEEAKRILKIPDDSDVLDANIDRFLDPTMFTYVLHSGSPVSEQKVYLERYGCHVEQSIIFDNDSHRLVYIMRDITAEAIEKEKKEEFNRRTAETADKVVERQMRIVQEIASLLGETAAETKIALTKLKESISDE